MASQTFSDKCALVTGAGDGIGRSIARRLAAGGARLIIVGRTVTKLESLRHELGATHTEVHVVGCDLNKDNDLAGIRQSVDRFSDRLDILVHCAGAIALAPLDTVSPDEFDLQYRINVRAPLLLTQSLLPLLKASRGQIAFINSSLGVRIKEQTGAYAASKHALKAVADTLRLELNPLGIRVLSVFPGNTATAMQHEVCRQSGKPYAPETMLQPEEVAEMAVHALSVAPSAQPTEIYLLPTVRGG